MCHDGGLRVIREEHMGYARKQLMDEHEAMDMDMV